MKFVRVGTVTAEFNEYSLSLSAYVFVSPFLPDYHLSPYACQSVSTFLSSLSFLSACLCMLLFFLASLGDGWIYSALSSLCHTLHREIKTQNNERPINRV